MDIAEKVAEQMEKVADDIGNHLPDGRLKDALQIVEDMAQNTAEGAHVTGELISKVEEQVESWIQQINFVEEAKKTKEEDDGAAAKGQA
ncbi:hypothetical protein V6N11_028880 [Hibiscus sabdariffa]|uniref:Uncharacterized protein n=2 Tax=Hibiscus sabdariffa TaxID=183260 RepID=A0ABR1ZVE1_9ROSI